MRAPRTEVRGTDHGRGVRIGADQDRFELRNPRRYPVRERRIAAVRQEPAADLDRDVVGIEPARGREQRPVGRVALAQDARRVRSRVEHILELRLDKSAFLLDDEDRLEPVGEAPRAIGLQRKRHRDLVQPNSDLPRRHLVDAEIPERLPDVEIGLAGGRDPEPRPVAIPHRAVEAVGPAEHLDSFELALVQAHLLLLGRIRPADPQPLGGNDGIVGMTISTRSGSISIEAAASTVSCTHFSAVQQPL